MDIFPKSEAARFLRYLFDQRQGSFSMLELKTVAEGLNLSVEDAKTVAFYLRSKGWIRFQPHSGGGSVSLTGDGVDEISRLAQPAWRRIMQEKSLWIAVLASVITALIIETFRLLTRR